MGVIVNEYFKKIPYLARFIFEKNKEIYAFVKITKLSNGSTAVVLRRGSSIINIGVKMFITKFSVASPENHRGIKELRERACKEIEEEASMVKI